MHWQKVFFVFGLITLLSLGNSFNIKAQSISGVTLSWDTEVGCQTYRTETDPDLLLEIFLDDIGPSECIQVCEYSKVSYTFNYPPGYVGYWTLFNQSGGVFSNLNATSFDIDWGAAGTGFITFDPSPCAVECGQLVTVKVPVVQTNGTIQGPVTLCLGEQGRYKLPQWPTTEIDWEIIGVVDSGIVDIYQSDQRNEVVITPYVAGTYTLRATYTNTLLKCSGEAEFTFTVEEQLSIIGDDITCIDGTLNFTNSQGIPVDWTITEYNGWQQFTTPNSINYSNVFSTTPPNYFFEVTYLLTATKNGYCDSEPKIITVLPKPDEPEISDNFNNVLVLPSSFTLNPGGNNLQFTIIPQNNFAGGITVLTIHGSVLINGVYVDCIYEFQIEIPPCGSDGNAF